MPTKQVEEPTLSSSVLELKLGIEAVIGYSNDAGNLKNKSIVKSIIHL